MTGTRVTTRCDLLLGWGWRIKAGERFVVLREWQTTRGERRLCLGTDDGTVVVPSCPERLVDVRETSGG